MPVIDATTLLCLLDPESATGSDPSTGEPITDAKARIDHLITTLEKNGEATLIPTPALSEVLVHAGRAGPQYLQILNSTRCFRIVDFDQRAAVELASMTREALGSGDLRAGTTATRAKLKFDRQIIAIARVNRQTTIYPDDSDIAKLADTLDLEVIPISALPSPPEDAQLVLSLGEES